MNINDSEWSALGIRVKVDYSIFQALSGMDYMFRSVIISTGDQVKVVSFIPENLKNIAKFNIFLRSINAEDLDGQSMVTYENNDDLNMKFLGRLINIDGVIISHVFSDNDGFHIYLKFPVFLKPLISEILIDACTNIPAIEVEHLTDQNRVNPFYKEELEGEVCTIILQMPVESGIQCDGKIEADTIRTDKVTLIGNLSCNSLPGILEMEKEVGHLRKYILSGTFKDLLLNMVKCDILTYRRALRLEDDHAVLEIVTPRNDLNSIIRLLSATGNEDVEILSIQGNTDIFEDKKTLKISK
ncbi:MAG: hypothetical protein M1496_06360 [Candidatus Thermoplasmatota archaeon]|nr:hypothetical protein [Candidatus Thermoplasmatota archaeon]